MKTARSSGESGSKRGETLTVRERTLAHVENLLRDATKIGAGIALVCGVSGQACKHYTVDPPPLPPPGACANPKSLTLDYCVKSDARWKKSGLKWSIHLNVRVEWGVDNMDFEGLTTTGTHVTGATATAINIGHQNVEMVLRPLKRATQVEVSLAVQCNKEAIPFRATLDLSGPRKKDQYIRVQLVR